MESDDDLPDEPPPEYLRMRRRSNTLPRDFLSKLRKGQDVQISVDDDDEDYDDSDGRQKEAPSNELTKKLHKLARDKATNGLIRKSHSPTPPKITINNNNEKTHILPPLKNRKYFMSSDEQLNIKNRNPKDANALLNRLIKVASDEALQCTTKVRGPLPRGSSLYESVLQDFGREEEERDFLSPLPSPNLRHSRRKIRSASTVHVPFEINTERDLSSPSNFKRHVHWSKDNQFNKYK